MKKEAFFYKRLAEDKVECGLCPHRCNIPPSKLGICGVRKNIDGILYTLFYGIAAAVNIDPIEKKPFYHFLPGSSAYSVSAPGCNFRCRFCQNWEISQVLNNSGLILGNQLMPEEIVRQAEDKGCESIAYTYTEPAVFFEYAYDTAKLAKQKGLKNVFVTNGYIEEEPLKMIAPFLAAANVDLKSFNDDFYIKVCGGRLEPVLDTIIRMKKLGVWIEVTTLIIPGENDSEKELSEIAGFIASLGKEIPWHISRFHPQYKFSSKEVTPLGILKKAKRIGLKAGLKYVYLGNVPEGNNTYCSKCGKVILRRNYFEVIDNSLIGNKCSFCGSAFDGVISY